MFILLIPLICLPVQAADVDVDQVDFYSLADLAIQPFGVGANEDVYGTFFQYVGNRLVSMNGLDVADMDFALFGRIFHRTLSNIQASSLASETTLAAYLERIAARLDFYLPRVYGAVDEVEGKLINLYNRLGDVNAALTAVQSKQDAAFNNFNSKFGSVFSLTVGYSSSPSSSITPNQSFSTVFSRLQQDVSSLTWMFGCNGSNPYLNERGEVVTFATGSISLPEILSKGLLGLSRNLSGDDKLTTFSFLSPDADAGGLLARPVSVNNLLDALGMIGTQLQNPLAKLQYVLADDDDIKLKDDIKENQDSFQDNFTGDGEGAVSGSQIKDVAGLGSSIKDTFSGAGSPGDVFSVLNDSGNYGFFSRAVADELDRVANPSPSVVDDATRGWLDECSVGDDGVVRVVDDIFDLSSYVEGLTP